MVSGGNTPTPQQKAGNLYAVLRSFKMGSGLTVDGPPLRSDLLAYYGSFTTFKVTCLSVVLTLKKYIPAGNSLTSNSSWC